MSSTLCSFFDLTLTLTVQNLNKDKWKIFRYVLFFKSKLIWFILFLHVLNAFRFFFSKFIQIQSVFCSSPQIKLNKLSLLFSSIVVFKRILNPRYLTNLTIHTTLMKSLWRIPLNFLFSARVINDFLLFPNHKVFSLLFDDLWKNSPYFNFNFNFNHCLNSEYDLNKFFFSSFCFHLNFMTFFFT